MLTSHFCNPAQLEMFQRTFQVHAPLSLSLSFLIAEASSRSDRLSHSLSCYDDYAQRTVLYPTQNIQNSAILVDRPMELYRPQRAAASWVERTS